MRRIAALASVAIMGAREAADVGIYDNVAEVAAADVGRGLSAPVVVGYVSA